MDNVFQSKWGFHPVSRETSRKLRFLNGLYTKALQDVGSWNRWDRKLPKNRVQKRAMKDETGKVIGKEIVYDDNTGKPKLWEEPKVSNLFFKKVAYKSHWLKSGGYSSSPVELEKQENNGFGEIIRKATKESRIPYPTAEAVKTLDIMVEEIDRLFDLAKSGLQS